MKPHQQALQTLVCTLVLAGFAGCATPGSKPASPPPPHAAASAPPAAKPAGETAGFEFADTEWQLVEILSMDGASFKPKDRSHYTVNFTAGGRALVRADCNRAAATWTAKGTSELQFGPVASTRMKCSPDSLWERYLAQFEWVRSYVTRDGHLFLATMADGAIIEFEPLPEP